MTSRIIGVAALLGFLLAGSASAQTTPPGQPHADGVVRPPAYVDKGMIRPTPNLPVQSTPVIHPRRLQKGRHGTVQVVPK